MESYIEKLFPYIEYSDLIKTEDVVIDTKDIYCPIEHNEVFELVNVEKPIKAFQAVRILPCKLVMLNEPENVVVDILEGKYGDRIKINEVTYDYTDMSLRIDASDNKAHVKIGDGYLEQEIVTDKLINLSANGLEASNDDLLDIRVPRSAGKINIMEWLQGIPENVMESADMFDNLFAETESGKDIFADTVETKDAVYKWLDAYFSLPEGEVAKQGGREVVPLLIGPTGVFKSATVKELCKKYGYRLVDFRVAFTSRLDYSGLFQMGDIDGSRFSYSCPMEEIVTCSDGFREYCKRAYKKIGEILNNGYMTKVSASDGESTESSTEPISDEQRAVLEKVQSQYAEYMKPVCLFFDEITRCKDAGVEGLLTEMLNQKRFNDMQMKQCKFVAATNLNLKSKDYRHNAMMSELDEMYDVKSEIDVAYANRFMPLRVNPEDVEGRWFEWGTKEKAVANGITRQNIHPVIVEYLTTVGKNMVYNDTPVLDAIEMGLTENETKSQTYPNYRSWEMTSNYIYSIDDEYERASKTDTNAKKAYKTRVISGLISEWGAGPFIEFLKSKGYCDYEEVCGEVEDEFSDFLDTALSAGVPALMVGPSSMGKTSRVKSYIKKQGKRTGLEPVLINIDLSAKDVVDLMGMPSKVSLVDYVAGDLSKVPEVGKLLSGVVKEVTEDISYGLTDTLTVRSPDMSVKEKLVKAKEEGREIVFMFDECFTGDTKVKLLDGSVKSFKELNEIYKKGEQFWVYSVDKNGKFVPGRATNLGITRKDSPLVEVTLDNGSVLRCTPEHPFMLFDGSFCKAEDLQEGVSLKAAYFKNTGYEVIHVSGDVDRYTHQEVGKLVSEDYVKGSGLHCHHVNHNTYDNRPDNLNVLTVSEHAKQHKGEFYNNFMRNIDKREANRLETIKDPEKGKVFMDALHRSHTTKEFRDNQSSNCLKQWCSGQFDNIDRVKANIKTRSNQLVNFIWKLQNVLGVEVTPENYEELRIKNTGKGKLSFRSIHLDNLGVTKFSNIQEAIDEALLLEAPVNHSVVSVKVLDYTEDVYDIEVENYHNFLVYFDNDNSGIFVHNCNRVKNSSVLSAMFEVVSDARYAGCDFSDVKDRVKVIAACNMGHSEMENKVRDEDSNEDGYSSTGSIDPALAARFSVFWKKHYDVKDVKSWISYMEAEEAEGNIDGTITNYFKNLDPEVAVEIIAKVEERQLAYALPSTRNLHQLSMDIKSMRGKGPEDAKLFYGKVLFDETANNELGNLYEYISSSSSDEVGVANKLCNFIDGVFEDGKDVWEPAVAGTVVSVNGMDMSAVDLMDNILKCREEMQKMVITPLDSNGRSRLRTLNKLATDLLSVCRNIDDEVTRSRETIFEQYVGEEFAREFTPFFNENFGSANDVDITIEMLSDKSLVRPFFKKYRSMRTGMTEEKYEESMLGLMQEYMKVHGTSLTPDVYAAFIDGMRNSLATDDGMAYILGLTTSTEDALFCEAEKVGDNWILGMLTSVRATQSDIDSIRASLAGGKSITRTKKSVIL